MKEIILKRLVLSNWKTKNLDVTFNQDKTTINAMNEVGKSSLQQAWNWLLTSYTSAIYPKNHELFDNRVPLTHDTPIASVKAWILIDGIEYTITKTAQAKFTRKRGSSEYVKDNCDVYKIYIDEIETTATDFTAWIEHNICPIDMLPYCIDGTFFTVLADEDKRKARKVLERIVEEIKDEDYKGEYSCLGGDLTKGYTIEQIEERTKNGIKPLRERLSILPSLISEKEKMLSKYIQTDYSLLEKQIEETRKDIEKVDNQILGYGESIKPIIGQRNAIFDLINSKTLNLNERRNIYLNAFESVRSEIKSKISNVLKCNADIQAKNRLKKEEYDYKLKMLERLKEELKQLKDNRNILLTKRDEIKGKIFTTEKCAYCGQELPIDMQEDLRAKFNENKKTELDLVVASGKLNKQNIDVCSQRIKEFQDAIDKGIDLEEYEQTEILEKQLETYESSFVPYEETEEYLNLKKEIDELNNSLPIIPQNNNEELLSIKKAFLSRLESLNQQIVGKYKAEQLKSEIDGLKCEIRTTGEDLAKQEGILSKCKEYIEERANIISGRVNDVLTDCMIVMFEQQKNGELTPSCTITDKTNVKYSTQSFSAKIKTCIAIQQLFFNHYQIKLPVFIDECVVFSTKNIPCPNTQTIYLYASDSPVLVVE